MPPQAAPEPSGKRPWLWVRSLIREIRSMAARWQRRKLVLPPERRFFPGLELRQLLQQHRKLRRIPACKRLGPLDWILISVWALLPKLAHSPVLRPRLAPSRPPRSRPISDSISIWVARRKSRLLLLMPPN